MSILSEKLRQSRTVRIEVGNMVFFAHRPTSVEAGEWRVDRRVVYRVIDKVFDWSGVTLHDIFPQEPPHPQEFDKELCLEWLADRPDLVAVITSKLTDAYELHAKQLEMEIKN